MKRLFHIQNLSSTNKIWNKNESGVIDGVKLNKFYSVLVNSTGESFDDNEKKIDLFGYAKIKETEIANLPFSYSPTDQELISRYQLTSGIYSDLNYKYAENLFQYLKWIREEVFENYRITNFPNLPSRKTCLWLCEEADIEKWWKLLYKSNSKKIIELELDKDSKVHHADGFLIKTETMRITDFENLAKSYWSGKIEHDFERETLFEGKFKVKNEFKTVDDI